MDYLKTKEYRAFLKTKREESKKNASLFPYIDCHAKVLRILRELYPDSFYEYQLAYDEIASRLVNEVR